MNPNLLVIPTTAYEVPDTNQPAETPAESVKTDTPESTKPENAQSTASAASVINSSSEPSTINATRKQSKTPRHNAEASAENDTESSTNITKKELKLAGHAGAQRSADDDDEFRRDRFVTPVTATRVDHGFKDVLGGSDKTIGRGTLGRGRGKGIRKALFAVDVPVEEDDDEVDTHVEHVGTVKKDKLENNKSSSPTQTSGPAITNGTSTKSTQSDQNSDSKQNEPRQDDSPPTQKTTEDEEKDEPITTVDGIEFNV